MERPVHRQRLRVPCVKNKCVISPRLAFAKRGSKQTSYYAKCNQPVPLCFCHSNCYKICHRDFHSAFVIAFGPAHTEPKVKQPVWKIVIRFATVISTPLLSLHLDQPTLSQKSNNQFGRLCWLRKSVDGCVHRRQRWSDQSIGKGCASHAQQQVCHFTSISIC